AGSPHADAAGAERADRVDADRVEDALLVLRDCALDVEDATERVVGRGLPHAAGLVGARPQAGDVARRRDEDLRVAVGTRGVLDLDPRVVHRGESRVVLGDVAAPLARLLRGAPRRGANGRDAV